MLYEWENTTDNLFTTTSDLIHYLAEKRNIPIDPMTGLPAITSLVSQLDQIELSFNRDSLQSALSVILDAMSRDKTIIIHGDYDADGICATSIVWEALYRHVGYKNVRPFIPHREDHGYGVSIESIDSIIAEFGNSCVVITVDCGITAREAVAYGVSKGLTFIVTDHHTLQNDKVPLDIPILHTYKLCGAGIAWFFGMYIHAQHSNVDYQSIYRYGLDLAALATIADIQTVLGFNRTILQEGLQLLTKTKRVGLKELFLQSGLMDKAIGTYEVGWIIAPRLNALGRLEHAMDSVRLLLTQDPQKASDLVSRINNVNNERQSIMQFAVDEAVQMVMDNGWDKDFVIVLSHDSWHEGILGLIAGRLVERFYIPVIVLGKSGDLYKGSARSIEGCNIIEIIQSQQHLLIEAGGHAMAAGLSIDGKNIADFRENVIASVRTLFKQQKPKKTLRIDASINAGVLSLDLVQTIELFAPFGIDNPKPLFKVSGKLLDKKEVGQDKKHVSMQLDVGDTQVKAIWFGHADKLQTIPLGTNIDCICMLEIDTYRAPQVQLMIKDIALG